MLLLSSPHLLDEVECGSDEALHEHEGLKDFKDSLQEQMKFVHRQHLQKSRRRPHPDIAGLICPEPRQAARHPMSARPEPPGPAGRSLPLPNAPGSASCLHETMRASCSFSYPRIPRCRGPHIGVPAWRQDSTLTPCVTGMPAAHRPFASAAGVSRNQGALPGAFQISQAPAEPPSIPCL